MSQPSASSAAFFEAKYQRDSDPWNFETSGYERRRYDAVVHAVGETRYRSAVEPGCSIGILTEALASRCDELLAFDFSATAVEQAQQRCQRFPHARICCIGLEDVASFAGFSLIMLSEIGYYFTESRWMALTEKIVAEAPSGSTLIAAHWTGQSEDHEISGDRVHEILSVNAKLVLDRSERHPGFRLERWTRS